MSGKHTPTPWRLRLSGNVGNAIEAYSGKHYGELDDGYRILATFQECCSSPRYDEQQRNCAANGAFIVEAVNSYASNRATIEALVGALEKCTGALRLMPEAANTVFGIPGHGEMTAGLVLHQAVAALRLARGGA